MSMKSIGLIQNHVIYWNNVFYQLLIYKNYYQKSNIESEQKVIHAPYINRLAVDVVYDYFVWRREKNSGDFEIAHIVQIVLYQQLIV